MVNVFIDTQVFVQKNFDFSNELFKRLIDAVEDDLISVYLTEVVKKEIESKIHENVYKTVNNSQEKFAKESKILRNLDEYKNIFNIPHVLDCISDSLIKQFEQFLGDSNAAIIPIEDISPTLIFDKYIKAEPPFSKKKKDEFPDAFSLLAIQKWAEKKDESISIISNDQDLKRFCENIENLSYEPSLESFFNSLTKIDSYNHQFIVAVYDANNDIIEDRILNSIGGLEFRLSDEDGDVNKIYFNDIELDEDPNIIEIEKDEGIATIAFKAIVSLDAEISYIDYASSPYDSEEGRYIFHQYEEAEIEDVVIVPILMTIMYQNHYKYEIEIIDIVINEDEYIYIEAHDRYDYR